VILTTQRKPSIVPIGCYFKQSDQSRGLSADENSALA